MKPIFQDPYKCQPQVKRPIPQPAKKFKPLLSRPVLKLRAAGNDRTIWLVDLGHFEDVKEVGVSNKEPKIDLKQANKTTCRGRMQNGVNGPDSWNFNC